MKTAVVLLGKTFLEGHPRAGEETHFREKVLCGLCKEACSRKAEGRPYEFCGSEGGKVIKDPYLKIHTCRGNYDYWKKKIDGIKEADGVLSIRQWSRKAYRSPQERIIEVPAATAGVQQLWLRRDFKDSWVDGRVQVSIEELAHHDGLSLEDFKWWFAPEFASTDEFLVEIAIVQFGGFRY
jgi:hypothetical protein